MILDCFSFALPRSVIGQENLVGHPACQPIRRKTSTKRDFLTHFIPSYSSSLVFYVEFSFASCSTCLFVSALRQ